MRPFLIFLFIVGFGAHAWAQDLSGQWKGRLVMAPSGCFPVYNLEFSLHVNDSVVTGTAIHFSDSLNYVKQQLKGVYHKDSSTLFLQETTLLTQQLKPDCVPCSKSYQLRYHRGSGNRITDEQIRGQWYTPGGRAADGKTTCEPGTVVLNRQTRNKETASYSSATLNNKTNELFKEISVDSGKVHIEFFDNGQIDGDTISVYVNDKPMVYHQMLKLQPIALDIQIDPSKPVQNVIMVGENLGTIPPNTALMIVEAGNQRHQLYLKADEKKNALVRFLYEKKEPLKN